MNGEYKHTKTKEKNEKDCNVREDGNQSIAFKE